MITIANVAVAPGTKRCVQVPVTVDLGGFPISIAVHVIAGAEPGPTLALLSCLHGSEWLSVEYTKRVVEELDPATLRGTVLAVPVANTMALNTGTRNTQDESDSPDPNRAFSARYNWIADQIAQTLSREVLAHADAMIDWHIAPWGSASGTVMYPADLPDASVSARSKEMARAYGVDCIQRGYVLTEFPGPRSSFGYAGGVLGIPNIGVELGGLGWGHAREEAWVQRNLTGVMNVMKHLGMLEGAPVLPEQVLYFEQRERVCPRVGGMFYPAQPDEQLLRKVARGEELGRVVDPCTFEVLERLISPIDGYLFMIARQYPVRPGYWAFAVVDSGAESTRWVRPDEM